MNVTELCEHSEEIPMRRRWHGVSDWCVGNRQDDTGWPGVGRGTARHGRGRTAPVNARVACCHEIAPLPVT